MMFENTYDLLGTTYGRVNIDACKNCGSEFFFEVNLNRYAADAYSATLGGDLQPIDDWPKQIRICICGHPVEPAISGGRVGRSAIETGAVVSAIQRAVRARNKLSDDYAALVTGAVARNEFDEALARVRTLEEFMASEKKGRRQR